MVDENIIPPNAGTPEKIGNVVRKKYTKASNVSIVINATWFHESR
jgi:hypothetical protein